MTPKFNLWPRKDGKTWKEYILGEISGKGAWYELRYGAKYFNNEEYKTERGVTVTVEKDKKEYEQAFDITLKQKKLTTLRNLPEEYIHGSLESTVAELKGIYGEQVTLDSEVTLLEFII